MSYDPQIYNFLLQSNHLPVQVADLKKIIVFVMKYTICLMGQIEIKYGSLTLSQIVYDWFCLGRFTKDRRWKVHRQGKSCNQMCHDNCKDYICNHEQCYINNKMFTTLFVHVNHLGSVNDKHACSSVINCGFYVDCLKSKTNKSVVNASSLCTQY